MKLTAVVRKLSVRAVILTLTISLTLPGVANGGGKNGKKNFRQGLKYEDSEQWDMAAQEFALAIAAEPSNPEYRLHYFRSLQGASVMLIKRGDTLAEQSDFESAYNAYRQAVAYDPVNEMAKVKMRRMIEQQKQQSGGGDANKYNPRTGNIVQASHSLVTPARRRSAEPLQSISFQQGTNLRLAINSLARDLGLNVLFDETARDAPISFLLRDVTRARALDLLLLQNKLTFEPVDRRTILVYLDNPQNRLRFERLMVKTFYAKNSTEKTLEEMRAGVQAVLGGGQRQIIAVKNLNAIVVRGTPTELQLVQDMIDSLDKNKAEVVIDVKIFEVSHTDALAIGNQLQLLSAGSNQPSLANLGGISQNTDAAVAGLIRNVVFATGPGALLAVPPSTLSMLQTKGNTKILASSQIHALNGEQNKTTVGRSVPVQTGQNYGYSPVVTPSAPGVTPTNPNNQNPYTGLVNNIQYRDIGLVITATPTITNDGYVEIKMNFETSNVEAGPNDLNPIFTQRKLETTARIQDGTTSIVAGVQQNIKTDSRSTIPVVGLVPILGRLFSTPQQKTDLDDIVITVTPHIARAPEIEGKDHLAQVTGPQQGGALPISIEDVIYRAQAEEEQERQPTTIAGSGQSPTTTNASLMAPAQVSQTTAPVINAPAITSGVTVQTVSNPQNTTRPVNASLNGNQAQPVDFEQVRQTRRLPSTDAGPPPAQVEPAVPSETTTPPTNPPANPPEGQPGKPPEPTSEVSEIQRTTGAPVPQAELRPALRPERVERLIQEEMKKAAANPASTAPAAALPPTNDLVQSPAQQSSAVGVQMAAPKSVEARVNMGLVALPSVVQVGQTVTVTVSVESRNLLNGAQLVLNFDPTKLQFKSAKDGGLFGEGSQMNASVTGGSLTANIKPGKPVAARASGSILVLEFVSLAAGAAQIEFDPNASRMAVASGANVRLGAATVQVQINR
jgi:general secretion pathway protein D